MVGAYRLGEYIMLLINYNVHVYAHYCDKAEKHITIHPQ